MEFKNVVFNAARDGKLRRLKVSNLALNVFLEISKESELSRKSECKKLKWSDRHSQLRPSDALLLSPLSQQGPDILVSSSIKMLKLSDVRSPVFLLSISCRSCQVQHSLIHTLNASQAQAGTLRPSNATAGISPVTIQ